MANFEGLIRQALASQNASDPAVRQRVYQSSRNALVKMLEKTGNTSDAVVRVQVDRLETSIEMIEAEYAPQQSARPASPAQDMPASPPAAATTAPEPQPAPPPAVSPTPPSAPPHTPSEAFPLPEQGDMVPAAPPAQPASPGLPPDYTPEPLFPPVEPSYPPSAPVAPAPTSASPASQQSSPEEPVGRLAGGTGQQIDLDLPSRLEDTSSVDFGSAAEPRFVEPDRQPPRQSASARQADIPQSPPPPAPLRRNEPAMDEPADIGFPGQGPADTTTTTEDFIVEREPGPVYKRKNPLLRRIWPIALALAVLLVILWILYALFAMNETGGGVANQNGATGQGAEDGTIITLLRPTDLSALVTAGRGKAEIVSQLNEQMLRLQSVRQGTATGSNAEPILLELERGVLRQIAGKEVTVEFYSKSGGSGPAQFAVQCDIGGDSACGRKRFRVGLQPERSIFSLNIPQNVSTETPAYLAINTDVTNAADSSGEGDVIDIIHVRLILDE